MASKIKWKIQERSTGRYRSFRKRQWPQAEYKDGSPAVAIYCEDGYDIKNVRSGKHGPLTVRIADYSKPSNKATGAGFTWMMLVRTFPTLDEAKAAAQSFIDRNHEWQPKTAS